MDIVSFDNANPSQPATLLLKYSRWATHYVHCYWVCEIKPIAQSLSIVLLLQHSDPEIGTFLNLLGQSFFHPTYLSKGTSAASVFALMMITAASRNNSHVVPVYVKYYTS